MSFSAFGQLIHLWGLHLQGNLLYHLSLIFDNADAKELNYFNLICGIILFLLFFQVKRLGIKIALMMLTLFFLMSFLALQFDDLIVLDHEYFYVEPLVLSALVTVPMIIISFILNYNAIKK